MLLCVCASVCRLSLTISSFELCVNAFNRCLFHHFYVYTIIRVVSHNTFYISFRIVIYINFGCFALRPHIYPVSMCDGGRLRLQISFSFSILIFVSFCFDSRNILYHNSEKSKVQAHDGDDNGNDDDDFIHKYSV